VSDSPNIRLDSSDTDIEFAPGADYTLSEFERAAQLKLLARREAEKTASSNGAQPTSSRLTATPMAAIEMRSIEWLEKPLWQRSAFQLLSGPKGSGKGTYLASLAARISRTGGNIVFVSTEDSAEIDLKPRLVAAGADISRCSLIKQHVLLPDDVEQLRLLALTVGGVALLVVDPVANHIGDSNSNNDVDVRHAIAPLNALANDLGCLLVGVRHPGKDRSRGAVASILGSTAWTDTPRAVVMIAVDDENPAVRHIQVVTGNRSLNGSAQAFRIDAVDVAGLTEPITLAVALGESAKSVDDLLTGEPVRTARVSGEELQALILRELATGEKSRDYLNAAASDELGASADSVYRSGLAPLREAGQVRAQKAGLNDGWYWHTTGPS
jgi:energy-coupling factor transporter ATP-binding protein EcfA2